MCQAEFRQQAFQSRRVAVGKKCFVERLEGAVDFIGPFIAGVGECAVHKVAEHVGQCVAYHRNHSFRPHAEHFECQRVITAHHLEPFRLAVDYF